MMAGPGLLSGDLLACVIYRLLGLAAGIHVTVGGYVEQPADSASRWIVTQFILG